MKTDRILAIASVIIGLPSFVLTFFHEVWAVGVLAAILLGVVAYIIWYQRRPQFTIKSVEKEVHFMDTECRHAKLVRRQRAVANHPGVTEFWCRNIGADGRIDIAVGTPVTGRPYRDTRSIRKLLEEQDIIARIVELAHDVYGLSALREAWDEFRCRNSSEDGEVRLEFTADSPFLEQFTSWLAHTWVPAELSDKPVADNAPGGVPSLTFLARHKHLDPLLTKYLKACIETPFSYFEVSKDEGGRRFTCCDLVYGTQHSVHEGAAERPFHADQILYARIVKVDGVSVIDAAGPWAVPEDKALDVKIAIRGDRQDFLDRSFSGRERDLSLRDFYWQFIREAAEHDSLRPQEQYGQSPGKAAERLSMMLVRGRTLPESEGLPQEILSMTYVCEHWVNERLAFLGNKTALEAIETPAGRLKVQALMDEIERRLRLKPLH